MVSSEDFSFPKISNSLPPKFAVSPSLWRVCGSDQQQVRPHEDYQLSDAAAADDDDEEEEEKMDMLWEKYFIQELKSIDQYMMKKEAMAADNYDVCGGVVEVCNCVQPSKTTTSNNTACGNTSRRVVLTKLFKKNFLININMWLVSRTRRISS
ncbi:hypothetical protein ACOSP7_023612 [Xanthoceras sorbifolium]